MAEIRFVEQGRGRASLLVESRERIPIMFEDIEVADA